MEITRNKRYKTVNSTLRRSQCSKEGKTYHKPYRCGGMGSYIVDVFDLLDSIVIHSVLLGTEFHKGDDAKYEFLGNCVGK